MSKPIQLIPPGLLGLLQLKNNGKNPQELPDQVQAIMEMRDWYMECNHETVVQTVDVANGAVGFTAYTTPIIVPATEYWFVEDYTVQTNTALIATSVVSFAAAWRIVTGAVFSQFGVGTPQQLLTGVAAGRGGFAFSDRGFFLPTGAELGIRVMANEVAAGNITYQGSVRITRLPL